MFLAYDESVFLYLYHRWYINFDTVTLLCRDPVTLWLVRQPPNRAVRV